MPTWLITEKHVNETLKDMQRSDRINTKKRNDSRAVAPVLVNTSYRIPLVVVEPEGSQLEVKFILSPSRHEVGLCSSHLGIT